jgi:hypothetical protein
MKKYFLNSVFKKRQLILLFFLFLPFQLIYAQNVILSEDQRVQLHQLAKEYESVGIIKREAALQWARENGIVPRIEAENGRVLELMYLNEEMQPVYYETRNHGASFTTGALQLQLKGNLKLNLRGKDINVGVWDSGSILKTHQEFDQGRVSIKDGGSTSYHATHVAGTIAAGGVDIQARGMASAASLLSYQWANDLAEMAAEASNGLILSNHSYGQILGWGWTQDKWKWYGHKDSILDYRFGFYGSKSKMLDQLAYSAPHYTIVWAAGNDRHDVGDGTRPGDGPFDCIGPEGIAKNVITVGAVHKVSHLYPSSDDVGMSSFSSWGPADDGRIKPDIVGAGVSIYSPTSASNTSYASSSGTSHSTPGVTGSLVLLQELYNQRNGRFMQSATLKGLAIHTVKETGNSPGPDYQFGWGLLDVEKAAQMIIHEDNERFLIRELSLMNNKSYEVSFEADGSGDITAVICWTDPAGSPVAPQHNPRKRMLVNDLDIRVRSADGSKIYFPWKMDVESPESEATKGDNNVDNVEKITIKNPAPGKYILRVTHKGILKNGRQNFSLILQSQELPRKNTFYWIGNSGRWSDAANWSLSSGGEASFKVPDVHDHVVFDENSFPSEVNTTAVIMLDENADCYSFSWFSNKMAVVKGKELTVSSSLYIFNSHLSVTDLDLVFTGSFPGNEIFAARDALKMVNIRFAGAGSWKLTNDINVKSIYLENGDLDGSNRIIYCERFEVKAGYAGKLDLTGAAVEKLNAFILNDQMGFESKHSTLRFAGNENASSMILATGDHDLWNVENLKGELNISGLYVSNRMVNAGSMHILKNIQVKDLVLEAGSELWLNEEVVVIIENDFAVNSTPASRVKLYGKGNTPAIIHGMLRKKFCFDFLLVRGIWVQGKSVFNAGSHSVLGSMVNGWLAKDCNDVVFAEFDYIFPCAGGMTHFKSLSSGVITDYNWDIPYDFAKQQGYSEKEIFVSFSETGIFPVRLYVQGDDGFCQVEKMVEVIPNSFEKGYGAENDNMYISSVMAPQYQWFRNGHPIRDAVSHYYINKERKGGVYQVMIHNDICNMISEPLIIKQDKEADYQESEVEIYPNPVKDKLYIRFDALAVDNQKLHIQLVDQMGRIVITEIFSAHLPGVELSTSGLAKGVYILHLVLDHHIFSRKIVIQ